MGIVKRVLGWALMILGVWSAVYPLAIGFFLLAAALRGQTFEEAAGETIGQMLVTSIWAVALGVALFLGGRALRRSGRLTSTASRSNS